MHSRIYNFAYTILPLFSARYTSLSYSVPGNSRNYTHASCDKYQRPVSQFSAIVSVGSNRLQKRSSCGDFDYIKSHSVRIVRTDTAFHPKK